jgi:hypothetical protein
MAVLNIDDDHHYWTHYDGMDKDGRVKKDT